MERGQSSTDGEEEAEGLQPVSAHDLGDEPTRRDFLYIATGAAGVVGAAAVAWPFIDQMRPDASTLAQSSVEVDIGSLGEGASLVVKFRGKPVFVRNRTAQEIQAAKDTPLSDLKDQDSRNANLPGGSPATDADRVVDKTKENILVMIGVCTHLGCIPLGQQGDFGGWFCPCHGSHYDTAGRIRLGPAPENLPVPPVTFLSDTRIRIG